MNKFKIEQVVSALLRCSNCPLEATVVEGQLICGSNKKPVELFNPDYSCPIGTWTSQLEKTTTFLAGGKVEDQPFSAKAIELGKSVASGFASEEVVAKRKLSCFGPPTPCPALIQNGRGSFCGECGCGDSRLAQLDGTLLPKLGWAYLRCPRRRPGFSNAV